ncbi:MAG TPA: ATP-dependent helicase [Thiotrichaceae bacterium]|nr:ATP-dependent helicase [Thiotrichaceae bacterium]
MELTDEQWAIINAPEHILKVNAVAGSGKTTTLLEYAKRRPKQRILYLTFNKSSSDEMKKKCLVAKLDNITVQTFHALAYYHANGRHYDLINDLSEWTIFDGYVKGELEDKRDNLLLISWLIKDMMVFYLNSSQFYIDEALLACYRNETRPQNKVDMLLSCYADFILKTIKTILTKMKQCEIPAIHDFYLKMFHLSKPTLFYDIILIDEAQDLSGVMLEVLKIQEASRIFVGDTFQQIYAFRYAINALDKIDCLEYSLTQTFRFDDSLARQISKIVNRGYSILNDRGHFLKIKGRHIEERIDCLKGDRQQIAVISRSVLKLFKEIAHYLGGDLKFYIEGGYESYGFMNARVFSVLYLYQGNFDKISDQFIRRFSRFRALRDFAKASQNRQLLNTCDLVQTYRENLFDINQKIKRRIVSKEEADVIFTTTHKAKGQEYQNVQMVKEDFITREQLENAVKKPDEFHFEKLREEINIFYVAATRAMDNISLHKF